MSIANKPRIDGTRLIALLLESIFFGMDWVLLFMCLSALVGRSKKRHKTPFQPIVIVLIAIFCCITGNWLCSTIQVYKAFIAPRHESYCVAAGGKSRAEQALVVLSDPLNIASAGFFILTILLGDWFLIYRLFIIWSHNYWIVIPPIIISVGCLVSGAVVLDLLSRRETPTLVKASVWTISLFTMTVACNVYSTSMISMRLISTGRPFRFHAMGIRKKIIEVLIQSAALYCLATIFSLVFLLTRSHMGYVSIDLTTPIIGLNFCLIVLRTHRNEPPNIQVVQLHDNPECVEFSPVTESSGSKA